MATPKAWRWSGSPRSSSTPPAHFAAATLDPLPAAFSAGFTSVGEATLFIQRPYRRVSLRAAVRRVADRDLSQQSDPSISHALITRPNYIIQREPCSARLQSAQTLMVITSWLLAPLAGVLRVGGFTMSPGWFYVACSVDQLLFCCRSN